MIITHLLMHHDGILTDVHPKDYIVAVLLLIQLYNRLMLCCD